MCLHTEGQSARPVSEVGGIDPEGELSLRKGTDCGHTSKELCLSRVNMTEKGGLLSR